MIETFIPLADGKGIKLVSNVNVGQFLNLKGDRLKLKQILINLVGNAVKFTNAGSVELNVLVQILRNDDYKISFMVLDTGLGLDESEIECVFEEFVQTSDLKGVGTGLGLSISSKLVSLMGGKISVESEKGKGSEFEFTLDFVGAANKAETREPEEALDHSCFRGAAILYVEDNKINQSLVKGFMQKLGLDIVIASSGTIGIELAKKSSFDMILMDLRMPDLDGFETTKIIRTFNSRVPIIALSANSFESDIKLAYECGMDDFMQKPVNKKKLVNLLTKHLDEKQKSA